MQKLKQFLPWNRDFTDYFKLHFSGKTALVTGASSGLGAEFARQLANHGANLVLVARRKEALESIKAQIIQQHAVDVFILPFDLAQKDSAQNLYQALKEKNISIDILINNAGVGVYGEYIKTDFKKESLMIHLNIVSLVELTRLFTQDMLKKKNGYILQVSSVVAYQATPLYATYAATKSFVLSFGESLNAELKEHGIRATVLSPGVTETEFLSVSGQDANQYQQLLMMKTKPVVTTGLLALIQGKASVVPGKINKLMALMAKLAPRILARNIAFRLMRSH